MRLKKKYSLQEISKTYKCVIKGNPSVEFDSVCSLTNSKKKSISYISDSRFLPLINYPNLECLITNEEISNLINNKKLSLLINDNPQLIFSKLINDYAEENDFDIIIRADGTTLYAKKYINITQEIISKLQ